MNILSETAGSFPSFLLYCPANIASLCLVEGMVDPCVQALCQQIPSIRCVPGNGDRGDVTHSGNKLKYLRQF